jgi:hypothetical protein
MSSRRPYLFGHPAPGVVRHDSDGLYTNPGNYNMGCLGLKD